MNPMERLGTPEDIACDCCIPGRPRWRLDQRLGAARQWRHGVRLALRVAVTSSRAASSGWRVDLARIAMAEIVELAIGHVGARRRQRGRVCRATCTGNIQSSPPCTR